MTTKHSDELLDGLTPEELATGEPVTPDQTLQQ
ncbi:hypothetical protein [Ralstonia phage RPZH3]|nr:hypothetical protein [Ralstonia phage RPZH3]